MKRRDFFKNSMAVAAAGMAANPLLANAATPEPCSQAEFPKAPGLTKYVSEFIVNTKYEDIPAERARSWQEVDARRFRPGAGRLGFGHGSAGSRISAESRREPGAGKASIIGTTLKAPPRFAAFANGVSIHADDFDDTQLASAKDRVYGLLTHPTVPSLPPAFALAELGNRSGKDFMLAYQVGVEVECKIAEAISPRHYNDGFHTTGTCGSFGSAAACAKLRGLNPQQTAYALGIAAAEGGGLRDNFGSMTKPFHAGHAAENGTVAVDLAALGWTAADDILEGAAGIFPGRGRRLRSRLRSWTGSANPGRSPIPASPSSRFPAAR